MAKLPFRIALGLVVTAVLLVVTGPLALYWIGLGAVESLPSPPSVMATTEQQAVAWKRVRGQGAPYIPRLNPYSYIMSVAEAAPQDPGVLAAWYVASGHLLDHRRYRGMFWWHLSGAALTIWVTRNWSAEQILSAACQSRSRDAG